MTCTHSHCTETATRGKYCPGHAAVMYQPLEAGALPQERIAHALQWGISDLDGQGLRVLDSIALAAVRALPKDLTTTDAIVNDRMHDLRLRIALEQARRARQWATIAAQIAGMETNPDADQDVLDQDPEQSQETDADRAAKLLRAALLLIMGPQQPGNGGGGRPVRPTPPGPRTPPNDGRALSVPGAPSSSRRGDDDIQF